MSVTEKSHFLILYYKRRYTYVIHGSPVLKTPHSHPLPPSWSWMSNVNQLKDNMIQGWLLYFIWSFLQVVFRFQYQLINFVWLSTDFFFSFSWIQSRRQSNFKKLENSFLPFFYSIKIRWGQGWAKASLFFEYSFYKQPVLFA